MGRGGGLKAARPSTYLVRSLHYLETPITQQHQLYPRGRRCAHTRATTVAGFLHSTHLAPYRAHLSCPTPDKTAFTRKHKKPAMTHSKEPISTATHLSPPPTGPVTGQTLSMYKTIETATPQPSLCLRLRPPPIPCPARLPSIVPHLALAAPAPYAQLAAPPSEGYPWGRHRGLPLTVSPR